MPPRKSSGRSRRRGGLLVEGPNYAALGAALRKRKRRGSAMAGGARKRKVGRPKGSALSGAAVSGGRKRKRGRGMDANGNIRLSGGVAKGLLADLLKGIDARIHVK